MRVGIAGSEAFIERVEGLVEPTTTLVPCDVEAMAEGTPDLDALILGEDISVEQALSTTQRLEETSPGTSVIVVAKPHPKVMRAAVLAGARDIWTPDMDDREILVSLSRVVHKGRRLSPPSPAPGEPRHNQVIVVLSPKGGTGKTTIAVNLATGLARTTDRSCALLDLDLRFGDVATALNLQPSHHVLDATGHLHNMAAAKTLMLEHPSGVHVLAAPWDPVTADGADPAAIGALIGALAAEIGTIVIDTAAGLDEVTLAAIDHATDLVIISTTDVFAVNSTRKLLDVLDEIEVGEPDRHIILNRANARVDISRADIEQSLGCAVDVEIPSTRAIPLAVNRGQSLFDAGKVARKPMQQLLSRFVEIPARHGLASSR